jgi:hypothetical protein
MAAQLREICAILSGLVIAADYNQGQVMIKDKNFIDNEAFFQKVFGTCEYAFFNFRAFTIDFVPADLI